MGLKIIGTGKKLPKRKVTNDELSIFLDTNDEWITSKTGIKSRYVCTSESLSDLAEEAANLALAKSGLTINEIDLIICSTVSNDFAMPSLACCVSQRLGGKCPAFDISAACTGFIYALDTAESYINSGKATNILIISADMMSRHIDWNDRNTCVLFGDGAGACVVSKGTATKYIKLGAEGDIEPLNIKSATGNSPFISEIKIKSQGYLYLSMQGQKVFKFAVKTIESEIKLALDTLNMNLEDINYFVLHQANKIIIESARTRLKQATEKFPMNISKYGNMSAASIPVLLDEMLETSQIKSGDNIIFIGFGAGMTTGTCVMCWE